MERDEWDDPEHPVSDDELAALRAAGVFAPDDDVFLTHNGIVADRWSDRPYRFSGAQRRDALRQGVAVPRGRAREYDEFFDGQGQAILVDSVVCELDVLGTASEVQDDEKALDNLRTTRRAFARATRWSDQLADVQARWFSDNAALFVRSESTFFKDLALPSVVIVAALMQLELALEGRFLRGGIARGPFHASDDFIYGKPLVDAYVLESKHAVVPRILVCDSLADTLDEHAWTGFIDTCTARDGDDDRVFLDYLGVLRDPQSKHDPETTLRRHRDAVKAHLSREYKESIADKYRWVARYHNDFCERAFPELDVRIA